MKLAKLFGCIALALVVGTAGKATAESGNLGYGTNLLYATDLDGAGFSSLYTIAGGGAVVKRFGVGQRFQSLAFAAQDVGYGPNLLYALGGDANGAGIINLNSISTQGAV